MKQIVIMPGGFHPFHAGHMALYNSARQAFPNADLYVAATNSQEERPFPFAVKEKLAKVAGVESGHFIQVKSPFQAKEITQHYNPEEDVLIFVRSEKDRNESPKPGGMKKDGTPAYFQPYTGKDMQPFGQHAYFAYLPTVKFGPGITSATEIRKAWPTLNDKRKTAMVMSLYPAAQKNQKLAANIVGMLDQVMGRQEGVAEGIGKSIKRAAQGWGIGGAPDMVTPAGAVKAFKDMDGQRLANFVASRKGQSTPKKGSAGAFADKVIDREMRQRGYGRVADKDEQGVECSLNEFAVDGFGDSGDKRSKLLASVGRLLDTGNKVDWQVPGQMGHVTRVQDDGITMKRWKMPHSRMSFFLPMNDDSRDSKYTIKMVAPKHYAVVSAEQSVTEGADGWIGNPAKWKEAVHSAHGPDVVFKNYSHPGQPGKRSVHAWDANNKIVGVYQRHNKMGMVQPNMQGVAEDQGFGTDYPGTYEQDTKPFLKNAGHRTRTLTSEGNLSESADYLEEK